MSDVSSASSAGRSLPPHAALLLVAIAYGTVAQGAFFGGQLAILEALVVAALVVALVIVRPRLSDLTMPETVATALVCTATLVSAAANGTVADGLPQIAFVGVLLAAVLAVRRVGRAGRESLLGGVVALGGALGGYAWFQVAFHLVPRALRRGAIWRASTTITYANAAGCLLMMCLLVALAFVVHQRRLASFAAYLSLVGLGATASRGAALGFVASSVLMCVAIGPRRWFSAAWPILVAGAIAMIALLPSMSVPGDARPLVALGGLVAGAALLLVIPRLRVRRGLLVVLIAGSVVVLSPAIPSGIKHLHDAMTSVGRGGLWSESFRAGVEHPVLGTGPEVFGLRYRGPGAQDAGRFTHNEYLQVFAEQGVVGLVAVLAGIGLIVRRVLGSRSDDWVWLGPSAALAGFAVHGATDFVWNVPVVPLVGAVLLAMTAPVMAD